MEPLNYYLNEENGDWIQLTPTQFRGEYPGYEKATPLEASFLHKIDYLTTHVENLLLAQADASLNT